MSSKFTGFESVAKDPKDLGISIDIEYVGGSSSDVKINVTREFDGEVGRASFYIRSFSKQHPPVKAFVHKGTRYLVGVYGIYCEDIFFINVDNFEYDCYILSDSSDIVINDIVSIDQDIIIEIDFLFESKINDIRNTVTLGIRFDPDICYAQKLSIVLSRYIYSRSYIILSSILSDMKIYHNGRTKGDIEENFTTSINPHSSSTADIGYLINGPTTERTEEDLKRGAIEEIEKYRDSIFNEGSAAICNHSIFKHFNYSERADMIALMGNFIKILDNKIIELND